MAAKILLTEKFINDVKNLVDKNIGARKIAKQLGVTRWQVQNAYKILGIYSTGIKKIRSVYLNSEKECAACKKIKPVEEFRLRYNKKTDRTSYECYCLICEYEYNKNRAKKNTKIKRKIDPLYKLHKNISWCIWYQLKQNKSGKNNASCLNYLEYNMHILKKYLDSLFEPWMNWDNYGIYSVKTWDDTNPGTWTWQLDHIIPQSDLPYDSMEHPNFKKCWELSNLRPLSAKTNNSDGVKRTRHKLK